MYGGLNTEGLIKTLTQRGELIRAGAKADFHSEKFSDWTEFDTIKS